MPDISVIQSLNAPPFSLSGGLYIAITCPPITPAMALATAIITFRILSQTDTLILIVF